MKKLQLINFVIISIFFLGCSQESKNKTRDNSNNETVSTKEFIEKTSTAYKIPSPVEVYMFLHNNNIEFNKNAINSIENIARYYTNASKALNFGVYVSDLAYCTVFAKHQETFLYFSVTRTLATDLGFTSGFDEIIVNRINANLYNSDSLYQITNDSYAEACNFLEETGKKDILALIFAGSWIESLFIIINSIDQYSGDDPVVQRFADQRFLLDNMIEYYKLIDNNIATDKILDKLFELQVSFDLLYDNPEDILITQTQYDEIVEKVKSIRNEIIS